MASQPVNRTKFFIGSTALKNTATDYASDTWVEIVKVFDMGEFGDLAEAIEDPYIGATRMTRQKGLVDGGVIELVVTYDAADEGQAALAAASKLDADHNIKVVLPDKKTLGGAGTTFYFRVDVLGSKTSYGEVNSMIRTTWSLAINSDRLEVAAS